MSTTRLFPLALMLSLALLTLWLDHQVRFEEGGHPSLRRHDPDYLVDNFTTTTYSRDGRVETVLSAAKMLHYPDDDSTELTAPRVMQAAPGNDPWPWRVIVPDHMPTTAGFTGVALTGR